MGVPRTYTVQLPEKNLKVTSVELAALRRNYVFDRDLSSRISDLLILDMYVLDAEFGVGPHEVLHAIEDVESGEKGKTGIRCATPFQHAPLHGLWHKHYFAARFLPGNILNGWGPDAVVLDRIGREVLDPSKVEEITDDVLEELCHRAINEPLEKRGRTQKLTGEWVIFIKQARRNYYLCCNTHEAGDQFVFDRIMEHCVRDFPELPKWLEEARGKTHEQT